MPDQPPKSVAVGTVGKKPKRTPVQRRKLGLLVIFVVALVGLWVALAAPNGHKWSNANLRKAHERWGPTITGKLTMAWDLYGSSANNGYEVTFKDHHGKTQVEDTDMASWRSKGDKVPLWVSTDGKLYIAETAKVNDLATAQYRTNPWPLPFVPYLQAFAWALIPLWSIVLLLSCAYDELIKRAKEPPMLLPIDRGLYDLGLLPHGAPSLTSDDLSW